MTAVPAREAYLHESAPTLFGAGTAVFDPVKMYRYRLSRTWGSGGTGATWIMLNPSTAGAETDDATIRRCVAFTKAWGLDGLIVVNLFALRATDPRALARHPDPVGPANDRFIREAIAPWSVVVAAWGAHKIAAARGRVVMDMIEQCVAGGVGCLGATKAGCPRHPLYVPASQALESYGDTGDPLSIEVTVR